MSRTPGEVVRTYTDRVLNQHDHDAIQDLVSEDFIDFNPPPGRKGTRSGLREIAEHWTAAFPDYQVKIKQLIEEGEHCAVVGTFTGTHRGHYRGLEGTGRKVTTTLVDFVTCRDGQMVESWGLMDTDNLMQQCGSAHFAGAEIFA